MPIPSIPGDRHSTGAADGRMGPTPSLHISSESHLTSVLKKSLKQNLFFFLQGHVYFSISVISKFTLRGAGSIEA